MCPREACNVSSSYMMRHVRLLCCVKKMNDGYDVSSVSLLFCLLLLKFIMWVLVSAWSETDQDLVVTHITTSGRELLAISLSVFCT